MKLEFDGISPITGNKCVLAESDTETGITSYMCMESGFCTTDKLVSDTDEVEKYENIITQLMRDIKIIDPSTNLIWYPAFLQTPIVMLYCSGTGAHDMIWEVAKVVPIPDDRRNEFPLPGSTDQYYENMLDTGNAELYDKALFDQAFDRFYEIIKEHFNEAKPQLV